MTKKEIEFLKESNAIEGVYDEDSLQQAIYAWKYLISQKEMYKGVMLKTHKILMLHQKLQPYERGYFRNVAVYIGNRQGLNAVKIREALDHLIMNMEDLTKNGKNQHHIFLEKVIKEHHIEYEKIHPFVDGNGRTGRMFLNWERLQLNLPILVIKENKKQYYYKWFDEKLKEAQEYNMASQIIKKNKCPNCKSDGYVKSIFGSICPKCFYEPKK